MKIPKGLTRWIDVDISRRFGQFYVVLSDYGNEYRLDILVDTDGYDFCAKIESSWEDLKAAQEFVKNTKIEDIITEDVLAGAKLKKDKYELEQKLKKKQKELDEHMVKTGKLDTLSREAMAMLTDEQIANIQDITGKKYGITNY